MGRKKAIAVGIVLVAAIVNVVQFQYIDSQTNNRYSALNRDETSNVIDIGYRDSPHFREAYGLYIALSNIAPGTNILTPVSGNFSDREFQTRALGFGRAGSITQIPYTYNAAVFLPTDLAPDKLHAEPADSNHYVIAASGEGGARGEPWSIIVDKRLHDDRHPSQREFIVLAWEHLDTDYHILFLETSILPDDIRQEIAQ